MTRTKRSARRGAVLPLAALSLLFLLILSPAALAQSVGDVTGQVGDATEQVPNISEGPLGDAIKEGGQTVGNTVKDTTDTVGETIGDTGGTVGDAVGGVEDGTTGTKVGDTIKDTSGSAGKTVKDTGATGGGFIKETSETAANQIDETVGDVDEAAGTGLFEDEKDGKNKASGNGPGRDKRSPVDQVRGENLSLQDRIDRLVGGADASSPLAAAAGDLEGDLAGSLQATSFVPGFTGADAIREAIEAAKAFAFPIALTILVGGFMLIQNRVDKKDPKLALAAVDTADELLSFS